MMNTMMQLKCCSCLVSESKSVRVTQIRPAVLQGLYEKKGIPGMRGWSKTATIYSVIVISITQTACWRQHTES